MSTSATDPDTESISKCLAIDGPTAVGKSVVGKSLAIALSLPFCDTGLMYRAATLAVLRQDVDLSDHQSIVQCVQSAEIDLAWDTPETPKIFLGGEDVSDRLRGPQIDGSVSKVAGLPDVRSVLVERQRSLADRSPVVMVGRDIGTFILQAARLKVFLDASIEERARRRHIDETNAGRSISFEEILESIASRDAADNTGHRAIPPEQAASDAVIIATDSMSADEVVSRCVSLYKDMNSG